MGLTPVGGLCPCGHDVSTPKVTNQDYSAMNPSLSQTARLTHFDSFRAPIYNRPNLLGQRPICVRIGKELQTGI